MHSKRILNKIGVFFITLFLSTFLLFTLIRLAPGDPVKMLLGTPETSDIYSDSFQERYEQKREELNLKEPIPIQYIKWINNLVNLDLGKSIYSNQPVTKELFEKLPSTIALTILAISIQLLLGLTLGVVSALNANRWEDNLIRLFCSLLSSLPGFSVSLILIYFFAVKLGIYEISTAASLERLWLPAITLGIISSPGFIRFVRTSVLEEMGKLYVANDLGLGKKRAVIIKGILSNASLQVITVTATTFANLIGGSVVIESVFSWPGIGKYAMDSILMLDYPVVQGYGLLMVILVIAINTLVDVVYILFDPQIKQEHEQRREIA